MKIKAFSIIVLTCLVAVGGCAAGSRRIQPAKLSGMDAIPEVPGLTDLAPPRPVEMHEEMYSDGKALRVRAYAYVGDDGLPLRHGLFTLFWENGNKKTEVAYLHGVLHGPRKSWYQNGELWISGNNFNGGSHGLWTIWFPSGQKAQEKSFDRGGFHGRSREWFSDGQLKHEYYMVRGERQGRETMWSRNGDVSEELEFVDDVLQP